MVKTKSTHKQTIKRILSLFMVILMFGASGCSQSGDGDDPPVCGDGSCSQTEDCGSCSLDCGACPSACGDGTCSVTEDCSSCAADCGACTPYNLVEGFGKNATGGAGQTIFTVTTYSVEELKSLLLPVVGAPNRTVLDQQRIDAVADVLPEPRLKEFFY
jgi:hypothetical protein